LGPLGKILLLLGILLLVGFYLLRRTLPRFSRIKERNRQGERTQLDEFALKADGFAENEPAKPSLSKAKLARVPKQYRKNFRIPVQPESKVPGELVRDEHLPPLSILKVDSGSRVTEKEINRAAGLIEKTLGDFGIPAKVVDFRTGPAVTQFAVEPGYLEQIGADGSSKRNKVRVSQISALSNDLALALSAAALRIEAPVPGKSYVGIEVPNRSQAIVRLRPVLESDVFQTMESSMAIGLGRDVAGAPVAADLSSMPHLLIAGTTGSGKSVCITALATCLAMNNTPTDLRLVLIDPKMVELIRFNGLPHLYGKVETDLERITGVLRWCTIEMDRRYVLLQEERARDLETYNRKVRKKKGKKTLPRIVVMIDELADLMLLAPDQTERTLVRLAQMARATGIHLVVATQRPSTDILTGLIKANFPGRISFAVASGVDSRVILDGPGADTLLGKGDMLYLAPEAAAAVRLQGVFVDDHEIEKLIRYWADNWEHESTAEEESPWESLLARQAALEDKDQVLEQAIEVVKQTGEASASMLQRRLRIGYPRAARLMDELEELGVVGEARSGGKTREVLIRGDDDPLLELDEETDQN
jgi:S-DNA-T family DNA segregation ATPase FtsK/SpoIIIE